MIAAVTDPTTALMLAHLRVREDGRIDLPGTRGSRSRRRYQRRAALRKLLA